MSYSELSLSDFFKMDIMVRDDGTKTPHVDTVIMDGAVRRIGLIGYDATEGLTDNEIREEAFQYYTRLMEEVNNNRSK